MGFYSYGGLNKFCHRILLGVHGFPFLFGGDALDYFNC